MTLPQKSLKIDTGGCLDFHDFNLGVPVSPKYSLIQVGLGSRRNQVHQVTVEASTTAASKFLASLSCRFATRRQSLPREKACSITFLAL